MDDEIIGRAMARSLHMDACRKHALVAWIVSYDPPEHKGWFVARLMTNRQTQYVMLADNLPDLRAALPPGLDRSGRHPGDLPEIREFWFSPIDG